MEDVGFEIEVDEFVVGYGMDYQGRSQSALHRHSEPRVMPATVRVLFFSVLKDITGTDEAPGELWRRLNDGRFARNAL